MSTVIDQDQTREIPFIFPLKLKIIKKKKKKTLNKPLT